MGIAEIEQEHEELVRAIEACHDLALTMASAQTLIDAVARLSALARRHFDLEERQMQAHAYRGLDAHANEHRHIAETLDTLRARLSVDPDAAFELLLALREWVETHIHTFDAPMMCHIAAEDFRREFGTGTPGSETRTRGGLRLVPGGASTAANSADPAARARKRPERQLTCPKGSCDGLEHKREPRRTSRRLCADRGQQR